MGVHARVGILPEPILEFKGHVIGWADLVSNIELKESFERRILNLVSAQIRTSQEKKP